MNAIENAAMLIRHGWDYEISPLGQAVTRSNSEEGLEVARDFADVGDWRTLASEFFDASPDGLASALSFFSDEAIAYFIGGYMLADLHGELTQAEPLFHLTHGFDEAAYGAHQVSNAVAAERWARLSRQQVNAVVAYLEAKTAVEESAAIASAALNCFWYPRQRTLQ